MRPVLLGAGFLRWRGQIREAGFGGEGVTNHAFGPRDDRGRISQLWERSVGDFLPCGGF